MITPPAPHHSPPLTMTSTLRAGSAMAFAPLFKLSSALARAFESLSTGGQNALSLLWISVEYARRIDHTEAARQLLGMGPLLLDVVTDAPTETVVRNAAKVMLDAVALLQREEIRTILQASVSLAQSQPVRDLVVDSSSTLLSLLHALQAPSVTRVRQHFEAYLVCILGANTVPKQVAAVSSATASQTHSNRSSDAASLGESVQLLLLIETVSLVDSSDSSATICSCPPHLPRALRQRYLDAAESRWLRSLARLQDLQLCTLLRFVMQAPMPQIAALDEKQKAAASLEDEQKEGAQSATAEPRSPVPSNARSLSLDDAVLSRVAAAAVSSRSSVSHYSRSRRASASSACSLAGSVDAAALPRLSLVEQVRADAEARALRDRIDASEADEHEPLSDAEASSDDEGQPHARSSSRGQSFRRCSSAAASSSSFSSPLQSASSSSSSHDQCAVHAPVAHARFLHCVREMMADRHWKES